MNKKNDFSQKMHSYLRHPASLIMMILVKLAALITFTVLIFLIVYILVHGVPYLKPSLFSLHYNSENASLMPALINTVIMTLLSLLLAVPIGIFSAIFLAEYAGKGNKFVDIIRLTTETLSGIPSIVYGLFGMLFFVSTCHWGFSLLAGAFCVVQWDLFLVTFPVLTMVYGILILLTGISKIQLTIDMVRLRGSRWRWAAVNASLTLICATLILGKPFASTEVLWSFTGAALVGMGIFDLAVLILCRKAKGATV